MKHLILSLTLLLSVLATHGQVKAPDFAYPKTVINNTEKQFSTAKKQHDEVAMLSAMTCQFIAQMEIDNDNADKAMATFMKRTAMLSDKQIAAVANLFAANAYQEIQHKLGISYSRDLPLYPRPEKMAQWSDDMFRQVVDSLCRLAMDHAGDMSLKKLAPVVTADELSLSYYPTVRDFVTSYITTRINTSSDFKKQIISAMADSAPERSNTWYTWQCAKIYNFHNQIAKSDSTAAVRCMELLDRYPHDSGRAIVIYNLLNKNATIYLYKKRSEQLAFIDSIAPEFKNTWVENYISNFRTKLLQPSYHISSPTSRVAPGQDLKLSIKYANCKSLKVNLYNFPTAQARNNAFRNKATYLPVKETRAVTLTSSPDYRDTSVYITIPRGYNVLSISENGKAAGQLSYNLTVEAFDFMPFTIADDDISTIFVLDARNGKHIANADITLMPYSSKSKAVKLGTTDANGMLQCAPRINGTLQITHNGVTSYSDRGVHVSRGNNPRKNIRRGTMTTDLGVYRLGDSVRWMGVVTDTLSVVADTPVKVALKNSEGKILSDTTVTSDPMGAFSGVFRLPDEARTGHFYVSAFEVPDKVINTGKPNNEAVVEEDDENLSLGSAWFMVSDFKVMDYRVDSLVCIPGIPEPGDITVSGRVLTYAGFGVPDADIRVKTRFNTDTITADTKSTADSGRFSVTLKKALKDIDSYLRENPLKQYGIDYFYLSGISVNIDITTADGVNVSNINKYVNSYPNTLYIRSLPDKIDIADSLRLSAHITDVFNSNVSTPLVWRILNNNDSDSIPEDSVLASGTSTSPKFAIDLKHLRPGEYRLTVVPADSSAAMYDHVFIAYDLNSNIPPADDALWCASSNLKPVNGLLDTWLYINSKNELTVTYGIKSSPLNMTSMAVKPGWNKISFKCPDKMSDNERLIFFSVDSANICVAESDIEVPKIDNKLNIVIESFRDKVVAGSPETWKMRFTDAKGNGVAGAMAVNIYNSKLDIFQSPYRLSIRPYTFGKGYISLVNDYNHQLNSFYTANTKMLKTTSLLPPVFNTYNSSWFLNSFPSDYIVVGYGIQRKSSAPVAMAMMAENKTAGISDLALNEEVTVEYDTTEEEDAGLADSVVPGQIYGYSTRGAYEPENNSTEMRTPDVFSALWKTDLRTDDEGYVTLPWSVPNTLTTWEAIITAWTSEGRMASVSKQVMASKPVMVNVNLPRFLRRGDKAVVIASTMNNSDVERTITTTAEIFNISTGEVMSTEQRTVSLAPGRQTLMSFAADAPLVSTADSLGVRVRASDGNFADGEQVMLPMLEAESFVRECINFYLNPGDTVFATALPRPIGSGFNSSLSFTANPMATIVEALPVLWTDVMSTATAQASAFYGLRVALGLAETHPEVAARFDVKALRKQADACIENLSKMQLSDGGWAWGAWMSNSSPWVTGAILEKFSDLIRQGYLPDNKTITAMIDAALPFYDSSVRDYDMEYSIIRPMFTRKAPSLNGQQVIDRTLNDITRHWRKLSVDGKALAVIALANNKRLASTRPIIKSLDEFATFTPSKGTEFKNERSLRTYGNLLEAYSLAAPASQTIDGLRQYLIVRRQATDWGSSIITSYVVSSMLNSGTHWQASGTSPRLTVDGNNVPLSAPKGDSMVYTAAVSGKDLSLSTPDTSTPKYGAVISEYTAPMDSIKAYSESDELFINKRLIMADGNSAWKDVPDSVAVGTRLRVVLTISTTRPLSYVNIVDQRPAAFEPAEQMPRYVCQDNIFYYRENRDATTNIHIEYLPKGTNVISYDVIVNNAGVFASGIATFSCDQAPTLNAHTAGGSFKAFIKH